MVFKIRTCSRVHTAHTIEETCSSEHPTKVPINIMHNVHVQVTKANTKSI